MERFAEHVRVVLAVLMFSALVALGFGAAPAAASPCADDVGVVQVVIVAHDACQMGVCVGQPAGDCCATSASCCQGGFALLAPEPGGLGRLPAGGWYATAMPPRSGVDPFVNRHPPRDLA